MKLGIKIRVDVTKIDKARIFPGKKGKYIDLVTFIDTEKEGRYGDHGFISQEVSKEEREQNVKAPILGNCTVFYTAESGGQQIQQNQDHQQKGQGNQGEDTPPYDDQIPF